MPEAVILIGIPGAGKSTFYRERFANTHVHISLDVLKTRARERTVLQECIAAGRSFVVKVEGGVARYAPVRVGVSEGERVELLSGIAAGDTVVRGDATTRLADGAKVDASANGAQAANDVREPSS